MRIIAGSAGGRRITAPKGHSTRPTAERVREALFSILGPPVQDARILDVFAGAGTLGLEALSRGAVRATFIDSGKPALRCLHDNCRSLGFEDSCEIVAGDALKVLRRLANGGSSYHWIFIDPPYATDLAARTLLILGEGSLCAASSTVVVEHDRRQPPADKVGCLVKKDCRRYGDTELSLYTRAKP